MGIGRQFGLVVAVVSVMVAAPAFVASAHAQDSGPTTTIAGGEATDLGPETPGSQAPAAVATVPAAADQPSAPLIAVPPGCAAPPAPATVFLGTVIAHDLTTARFHVDQVRAGTTDRWEIAGQIDVVYGDEVRFLDVNQQYLVGAAIDQPTGRLSSKVSEHAPLFGGSAVIGLDEGSTDCPFLEDGLRTLHPDGSTIDSGVLAPLRDAKGRLLGAVLKPLAWSLLALLALVVMKHLLVGFVRSMRAEPTLVSGPRGRNHRDDVDGTGAG